MYLQNNIIVKGCKTSLKISKE